MKKPTRADRGQALVLFSLTLLLMTLMVTMTLAFGTMAKEKMEQQQVADQAAYSQAVATARSLNAIALHNRAMLSHFVALLGVQSAISFTTAWKAFVTDVHWAYDPYARHWDRQCACLNDSCPGRFKLNGEPACCKEQNDPPDCSCYAADDLWCRAGLLAAEYERIRAANAPFKPDDTAAGKQAYRLQVSASVVAAGGTTVLTELKGVLGGAALAKRVVNLASKPELSARSESVSVKEIDEAIGPNTETRHTVLAAMGSRGNPFTVKRRFGERSLNKMMEDILNNAVIPLPGGPKTCEKPDPPRYHMSIGDVGPIDLPGYQGSSYFADDPPPQWYGAAPPHGPHGNTFPLAAAKWAWGEEHYRIKKVTYTWRGNVPGIQDSCSGPNDADRFFTSYVKTTDKLDVTDEHKWDPVNMKGSGREFDDDDPPETHTTQECVVIVAGNKEPCKTVWTAFTDYQPPQLLDPGNAYGQPKTFGVVQRDYGARPNADPWNLAFRFRFSTSGNGQGFALRGDPNNPQAGSNQIILVDGTNLTARPALSTGIAYYHRMDHWKETPNTLNAFWRAGLVHADVDGSGLGEAISALNANSAWGAGDAVQALVNQGFRGIP